MARRCGAKHISKSNCTKHTRFGPSRTTFGRCDVEAVHDSARRCAAKQISKSKYTKHQVRTFRTTFGSWDVKKHVEARREVKMHKTEGYVALFHVQNRSDIFSRGSRSTRDLFIRAVPERGWGFTEMILRDRCSSTKYDRRSSLDRWSRKNEKPIGTRLSGLHSTFHFGRKTRRIASFLTLSSAQILEVSLNCRDFDAVKYKNSGSLAE